MGSVSALPVDLTSFVGRERELAEIQRLLTGGRLLTLTGAGGSGKSRLALEVAERSARELEWEVAWAELAAIEDPGLIFRHVAEACGMMEGVGEGGPSALAVVLCGRRLLLVLDNCEHLVEACAELVDALLRHCPEVRILATSREALGVRGERAWLVPALSLPEEAETGAIALASSEAVRLFVERARDVHSGFDLTDQNAPAVAEICRRLDGIPLAIELAAARVKVLHPEQIRDRLDDAFRLLTSGSRTAIARHRTLRAAIDWSHDLLPEEGRVLLRRLSVFRGGFSLDAVEAIGAGRGIERADVLDLLSLLVDRSLVAVREQGGGARYGLLETVRQYAAQKLTGSDEEQDVCRRHASFFAELIAEAEPHFIRRERRLWVERLLTDLENVREALAWSRVAEPQMHVRMVGMLWWFWYSTRHWREAGRWIADALALPQAASFGRERAALLFAGGALAALQARSGEARPLLEEAREIAERSGDESLHAYALNYLGLSYAGEGDPRGTELSARAARWFDANRDLYGLRLAYLLQGTIANGAGDFALAERMNREGVRVAREFGQDRELAMALQNLAAVYVRQKDVARAMPALREALAASKRDPSYFFISIGLMYTGETLGYAGHLLEAARILGAADALGEMIGMRKFKLDADRLAQVVPTFREAAGGAAFDAAWSEGRGLTPEAAIDWVLEAAPTVEEASPLIGRVETPAVIRAAGASVAQEPAGAAAVDLRVRALGPLKVEVRGVAVPPEAWTYAKPKELLAYLLSHPGGRSREAIGEALWPGATAAQVKNSFHVTLHHLRKALGHSEWITRRGDSYMLAEDVNREFDAARFEAEVRAALSGQGRDGDEDRLVRALALYGGDYLEGHPVARWHEDERDRLRSLYVQASLARARALENRGAFAEVGDLYHAIVQRDQLNEEAHRGLMLTWARAGNRTRALRHYDHLVAMLRDLLDAEPEPESVRLHERIRSSAVQEPDSL